MGHGGHAVFGQKLLNIQGSVGRCTHKSPIMKRANVLSLQKNSLKLNTASHNSASWYTDTGGFLEHSPSVRSLYYKGPALQKIILFWGEGPPSYTYETITKIKIINISITPKVISALMVLLLSSCCTH